MLLVSLMEKITVNLPETEVGRDGKEQQWGRLERKGRLFTQCWTQCSVIICLWVQILQWLSFVELVHVIGICSF